MAVIESGLKTSELNKSVLIICPICKIKKQVNIPKSIINDAKQLTSISISKNIVCDHHFQAFIDKNYIVRGYQKVDYQLEDQENKEENRPSHDDKENDEELFNNLILEKNYVEYKPRNLKHQNLKNLLEEKPLLNLNKKKMNLEDIYEEFWEFISDDNEEFIELIRKDARRRNNNRNLAVL